MSRAVIVIFTLLHTGQLFSTTQESLLNANLGGYYLEKAAELYTSGSYETAFALAKSAAQFIPESSDLSDIKARLYYAEGDYLQALTYIERALSLDNWQERSPYLGKLLQTKLYLQFGQYLDAEASLKSLPKLRSPQPQEYVLRGKLFIQQGNILHAREILSEGWRLFPYDTDIYYELSGIDSTFFKRQLTIAAEHPEVFNDEALLDMMSRTNDREMKAHLYRFVTDNYQGGEQIDFRLILTAWDLGRFDDHDITGYFSKTDFLKRSFINGLALETLPEAVSRQYNSSINSYSGSVWTDSNEDGVPEVIEVYENGIIQSLSTDWNQDGRQEWELIFNTGRLAKAEYHYSEETAEFSFTYPYVSSVVYEKGSSARKYILPQFDITLPILILGGSTVTSPPVVKKWISPPSQERLSAVALEIRESSAESTQTTWNPLIKDFYKVQHKGTAGNKRVDFYFKRDLLLQEYDPDGDGYFQVVKTFLNGSLLSEQLDDNGDGINEYMFLPGENDMELWDINQDGEYDIRKITSDGIRYEYSPELNGVFTSALIMKDRALIAAVKDGRFVPVSEQDGLFWIGKKVNLSPADLPASDGLFFHDDQKLFIFSLLDKRCIEVIN